MAAVDRLGWAATIPLRAGGYVLGARVNTLAVADLLRELFAERVVDRADPPSNLSLHLSVDSDGEEAARRLHQLYLGCSLQQRTRDPLRTVGALWHELRGHDVRWARRQLLLDAAVLVKDGRAHILPASVRRHVVDDLRRWEMYGLHLWDARWVELDLSTAEVVLRSPPFADAVSSVEARSHGLGIEVRSDSGREAGRLPIASWTVARGIRSPAERVMRAAGQLLDRADHLDASGVRQLAAILAETGDLGPQWTHRQGLRTVLQE